MPRYSNLHYETLETESATRKTANAAKRRRLQGSPKENEFELNAYNIGRSLSNLAAALSSLAEEHQTLSHETTAGVDADALRAAVKLVTQAADHLPKTYGNRSQM